ncbi:MAG TPA: hypothetical protein VGM94_02705 [Galbitalea sp.]|jgi:hypothetical protein
MNTTTPDPTKTISPKVIASVAGGIVGAAVVGAVNAITPDLFASLGAWAPVVYSGVTAGGAYLAGWIVKDPLRQ